MRGNELMAYTMLRIHKKFSWVPSSAAGLGKQISGILYLVESIFNVQIRHCSQFCPILTNVHCLCKSLCYKHTESYMKFAWKG